jgi:Zn-dependent protease
VPVNIGQLITPDDVILIAIFLLIGFPVHEFAHALVAYRQGDATAKMFGRLTLNPVTHFDPLGGLFLIVSVLAGTGFIFGWAKPTPVNPGNLRDRRNGEVLVSLAGPASNLIMAAIMALVVRAMIAVGADVPDLLWQVVFGFVWYNVALAVFNFIPIPPLDGASLLFRFLPARYAWEIRPMLTQYGMFILLFLIFFGGAVLGGVIQNVARFLVGF